VKGAKRKRRATIRIVAGALCVSYILSTLPTPLYVLYRQAFHFSRVMLTVIYAIYVVGSVLTLFFLGRLSDQIGRRPVVLMSLGIAALGAFLFLAAQGTGWLFPARIFSGLGRALVSGAATAWIIEAEPRDDNPRAPQWAIGANFLGLFSPAWWLNSLPGHSDFAILSFSVCSRRARF